MRMRLSSALLVLLALVRGGAAAPQELARVETPQHLGFIFSPGTCEQGPEFCALTHPRGWAPDEIALVRSALDQIAANALGRQIIQRARQNGFHTLRRFEHAAEPNERGGYDATPMIVAKTHTDDERSIRTIDLTDRFFERVSVRDHFSGEPGYLLTTEILAHELVHALDLGQRYSGTDEFRKVSRLGLTADLQREADEVNVARMRLNAAGEYDASWQASRSFGVLRLRRLPSVHALDGYREALAELIAHLVLDPNARRRTEPRVLRYFDTVVFEAPSRR